MSTVRDWTIYNDGHRWTPRARSLLRALDLGRFGVDLLSGRPYPRCACEPADAPECEGGEIVGVVESGFGRGASYYAVRRVGDSYVVAVEPVTHDEAKLARASTLAELARIREHCEKQLHRDNKGEPLVIPRYKSGKHKGEPKWPRQWSAHIDRVAENEALLTEVGDATTMAELAERAVEYSRPPAPVVPLSERSDEDLETMRADAARAASGLTSEVDYGSQFAAHGKLHCITQEIARRSSVRTYGFDVGTRVDVEPLRSQRERGVPVRRGTVEGVEGDANDYTWSDPRYAHRRVVKYDTPYEDLGETVTHGRPSVDQLTKVGA